MIVIYPGSFDPFTLGHEDIIKRALSSFDKLKIAVSEDNAKTSVFSLTERLEMAEIIAKKYQPRFSQKDTNKKVSGNMLEACRGDSETWSTA